MLTIQLPAMEMYAPDKAEFLSFPATTFRLEHSLRSIAKWEAKTHRSFFDRIELDPDDFIEYVRCMTIDPIKDPTIYEYLRQSDIEKIANYINDPMTARSFKERKKKKGRKQDTVTAESIYYLMIEYGIPFDCENWHFNRLMALIRVCETNNSSSSGEQMSYRERQKWYNELNDQRRKRLGTKG